ncbi:MAG: hypothetical protein J7K69_03180 [Thermotogae bacterium]|nr:hypothetical protein [Thermotogota bacterium]
MKLKFESSLKYKRYIESSGKKSCIMGYLNKGFEVWSYPVKLLRDLKRHIFVNETNEKFELVELVHDIVIKPECTEIVYVHPLFKIKETVFAPINFQAAFLIYDIDSSTDFEIIFSFFPELNLMWPGAIGGQFSYWADELSGFVISEPTDKFSAIIRVEGALKYSYEGDHSFSDIPYSILLNVSKGENRKILNVVGGVSSRKECKKLLSFEENIESEMKKARDYYQSYLSNTLSIKTPDEELNKFFEWAKISMLKGVVNNPILGEGLIAGVGPSGRSTRPGFDWFFAGDMSINSLSITGYNDYQTVKRSLEFYAKYQNEDGRIPHEISQSAGLIEWFEKYGNFAYLHADTTAWYLLAFANYIFETGDFDFAEKMKKVLIKAYKFYDKSSDKNGMILNEKVGLGALEVGEFKKPKYDIYTNGIYLAALRKLLPIMKKLGEETISKEMENKIKKISEKIEDFWIDEKGLYALSVNTKGELLELLTPWAVFPIAFGLLNEEKAKIYIDKLKFSSIFTPWGVRSVERGEYYDPLNYNFGTVWYFINGFVSLAAFRLKDHVFGWQIIKAAIKAFWEEASTHLPEVFSGDKFVPLNTAVPHQLFSMGPIMMSILKGILGIEKNTINSTLTFKPQLPIHWDYFELKNLEFNGTEIEVEFKRKGTRSSFKFKNRGGVPVFIELILSIPSMGGVNIETPMEWYLENNEIHVKFELRTQKTIEYIENGVKFSIEYKDLKYGFSNDAPVLYHFEDQNEYAEITLSSENDAKLYLWTSYDLRVESGKQFKSLGENIYELSTSKKNKKIQIKFLKSKEV